MISAAIDEIFSSIQGEGPWIGERHIFIRFLGCELGCRYCDTPDAVKRKECAEERQYCRAQKMLGSFEYERISNPVSAGDLDERCSRLIVPGPSRPCLSLTGGEPLHQHEFLAQWLPGAKKKYRVYLETSGIHYAAMNKLKGMIDVVSMDFKLPSATGLCAFWEEHRKFLDAAAGLLLFVKAVVTEDTIREDILTAARIIKEHDQAITLVIQPASGRYAPAPERLLEFQEAALGIIPDVRVIPQAHKIMNVP